jgi:hypothetical protein
MTTAEQTQSTAEYLNLELETTAHIRDKHICSVCDSNKEYTTKSGETLHIKGNKHKNALIDALGVNPEPGEPMVMSDQVAVDSSIITQDQIDAAKQVTVESHIAANAGPVTLPAAFYTALPEESGVQIVYKIVLDGYLGAKKKEDEAKAEKITAMNQAKQIFGARFNLEVTEGKKGALDVEPFKPEILGMAFGPVDMVTGKVPVLKRVFTRRRGTIEADLLADQLLKSGIDSDKVAAIIENSTKTPDPGYSWSIREQAVTGISIVADEDVPSDD